MQQKAFRAVCEMYLKDHVMKREASSSSVAVTLIRSEETFHPAHVVVPTTIHAFLQRHTGQGPLIQAF